MEWPVGAAVRESELPLWQFHYLAACPPAPDPTIVWGSEVDVTDAEQYLRQLSRDSGAFLSLAHVLVRATACALQKHPEFNRRVIGKRVYPYRTIDLLMPIFKRGDMEVDVLLLDNADQMSLVDTARRMWNHGCQAATRGGIDQAHPKTIFEKIPRFVVHRLMPVYLWIFNNFNIPLLPVVRRENRAVAMLNYFGSSGSPPMRAFKPSRFPTDAVPICITMGATEDRATVVRGEIVPRRIAPVFFRADHRLCDGGYAMREFLRTLLRGISDPASLDPTPAPAPAETLSAASR